MSRSLDVSVLARLRTEDARAVYDDVTGALADLPADLGQLLEIEVLGDSSHPLLEPGVHLLRDGAAVAVPKLRVVQAFFVARRILHAHLAEGPAPPAGSDRQVLRATTALLLMDSEHLTAASIRKRALLADLQNATSDPGAEADADADADAAQLLRRELQFVDSLLTAHLHRHTKSPTLWGHRRWLLGQCAVRGVGVDPRGDLNRVVMVAGERHPRNYYAWDHARWLFREPGPEATTTAAAAAIVAGDVKKWCFRHPSDTSGWSFLLFLVSKIPDPELRRTTHAAVVAETLELADAFRWVNESVWVFLRTMVAEQQQVESFVAVNEKLSAVLGEEPGSLAILRRARDWLDKNRVPVP